MSSNEPLIEQTQDEATNDDLVQRIGQLTRMLRESMRELGLDKEVEKAAVAIPDARDRLNYVASMTEHAAERALNAIDRAQPLQDGLSQQAEALNRRWAEWFAEPKEMDQAKELVQETRAYLAEVPGKTQATSQELLEIMMAQDFQDLTGQVIKKLMCVIREIESQLVLVLIDSIPHDQTREEMQRRTASGQEAERFLSGPAVAQDGTDVVNSQDQVDDLLDDLGF